MQTDTLFCYQTSAKDRWRFIDGRFATIAVYHIYIIEQLGELRTSLFSRKAPIGLCIATASALNSSAISPHETLQALLAAFRRPAATLRRATMVCFNAK